MTEIRPARAYEGGFEFTARAPNHKLAAAQTTTAPQVILIHSPSAEKRKLLSL